MPSTVRTSMAALITLVRLMIFDPSGGSQQFLDSDIQDRLDASREDIRYESLAIAPSIVNTASTSNVAQTIFADYYSSYQWWESDAVLQGQGSAGQPWVVLTPLASDYITGHFQFELTPFVNGTIPGQMPPVFCTGKVYDPNAASADLCEFWAAMLAGAYDVTVDSQTLRRSQQMAGKLMMAKMYRQRAKPIVAKLERRDVLPALDTVRTRLLDSPDSVKGA